MCRKPVYTVNPAFQAGNRKFHCHYPTSLGVSLRVATEDGGVGDPPPDASETEFCAFCNYLLRLLLEVFCVVVPCGEVDCDTVGTIFPLGEIVIRVGSIDVVL